MKKFLLSFVALLGFASLANAQATGSKEAPLSVDDFIAQGVPASPVANTWVKGYIVGCIDNNKGTVEAGMTLSADGAVASNILLAGSTSETDLAYMIPVQLESKTAIRSALNLIDHPENLHHEVIICGSHEGYFKNSNKEWLNGLKTPTAYEWVGDAPVVNIDPVISLNETFTSIPSNWSNIGSKPFYTTSFNNVPYAAMTGYKGTAPFDQWLITPPVDIEKCDEKVLTFRNQVNGYGSTTTTFKVYVLDGPDPATANKTELNAKWAVAPESGYSDWADSGNLDLSSYKGLIYIGWNYVASEDANYATWCITDVKLNAGAAPIVPPVVDDVIYSGLSEDATALVGWTIETIEECPEAKDGIYTWKTYQGKSYLNGSTNLGRTSYNGEAIAYSEVIDLTGYSNLTVNFDHCAKFQTTLKDLCWFGVRVAGETEWTKLTIPTWPEAGNWTWANSGDIDLNAYAGKKIQLCFHYEGSAQLGADTWEVRNVKINGDSDSGVGEIDAADVETIYFTLDGVKVQNPEKGLYIVVKGNKAYKVIL